MNVLKLENMTIRVYDKPLIITSKTIKETCEWYADNALKCIAEVKDERITVNNPEQYIARYQTKHENYKSGDFEPWLGFWQQAVYLQTNESIPMMT
jgi:hypothetical protein